MRGEPWEPWGPLSCSCPIPVQSAPSLRTSVHRGWRERGWSAPCCLWSTVHTPPDHHCLEESIKPVEEGLLHHLATHPIQELVECPGGAGEWTSRHLPHLFPGSWAPQIQMLGHPLCSAGREQLGRILRRLDETIRLGALG